MNDFFIRTPIFSSDQIKDLYNSKDPEMFILDLFSNNNIFRELIYSSSKILFTQAEILVENKLSYNDSKKRSVIAESLTKYFLRMCYRATPFGLAAGISHGKFTENVNSEKIKFLNRSVKIDSGVLTNILSKVGTLKNVSQHIKYYTNNTVYQHKDYYRYIERKEEKNSFDFMLGRVEMTHLLEEVLELGENGITWLDIYQLLKDEDTEDEEIDGFITELISSQLVVSELQYDVLDINIENKILHQLKILRSATQDPDLDRITNILDKSLRFADQLRKLPICSPESLNLIQTIDSLLFEFNDSEKTTVQVDLINDSHFTLPNQIQKDIENKISVLSWLHKKFEREDNGIISFKKEFIDTYGSNLVPLLAVLDSEIGIGYPPNLAMDSNSRLLKEIKPLSKEKDTHEFTKWDAFLLGKYEKSLLENYSPIKLEITDLKGYENKKISINDSGIFTGQIFKTNEGTFKYYNIALKIGAAHFVLNRFAYGSEEIQDISKTIVEFEKEKLSEHQVFSEVLHLSQPKLGNVTLRPNYYGNFIPIINTSKNSEDIEIPLNDLYVFVKNDIIGLYSERLGMQVLPRIGCAQNTNFLTNPIYKFLGAISDDYFIGSWDWGFLKNRNHLPRVEFDNLILSKEKWRLNYKHLKLSANSLDLALNRFIKDNNVPRHVTMSSGGDNLLPLDLTYDTCLRLLLKELATRKSIILEESLHHSFSNAIATNDFGPATHEICIPILFDSNYTNNINYPIFEPKEVQSLFHHKSINSNIRLLPFQKALFVKLYIKKGSKVDEIFVEKMLKFFLQLMEEKLIDSAFFIRYIDPEYHFRLRFFSQQENLTHIFDLLKDNFVSEIEDFQITKIQIDTYEREVARYGGILGMEISENIFFHDSLCVLQILNWIQNNNRIKDLWLFALVGVHYLFNDFNINNESRIQILSEMRDYYYSNFVNIKETKKNISSFYRNNGQLILDYLNLDNFEAKCFNFYAIRSSKNQKLVAKLNIHHIEYDVKNYIHMFLNRLFDYDQNQRESMVYDLLIQSYKSLNHINNHAKVH